MVGPRRCSCSMGLSCELWIDADGLYQLIQCGKGGRERRWISCVHFIRDGLVIRIEISSLACIDIWKGHAIGRNGRAGIIRRGQERGVHRQNSDHQMLAVARSEEHTSEL